jgi:hypothetical protein
MRKFTSAIGVAALATLPLGLTAPSALADNPHTALASCDVFGPGSHGPGITFTQTDGKITLSIHCTNVDGSPSRAVKLICSDVFGPDVKGQFVLTPSGNVEGHCTFPL